VSHLLVRRKVRRLRERRVGCRFQLKAGDIVWWGRWFAGWGILYCSYSIVKLVFFNCLIEIDVSDE
jgi:hypothetical protein